MNQQRSSRVAWLLPSMGRGGISWQHILREFTQVFPNTRVFTGEWVGYVPGFEDSFELQTVGRTQFMETGKSNQGYGFGFSYASPTIIYHLLKFRPQVVITNAFSVWSILALLFKFLGGWRVIVAYEGGSPNSNYETNSLRLRSRRFIVAGADGFVANSQAGKDYLVNVLGASPGKIFCRPFLVPSLDALLRSPQAAQEQLPETLPRPVFLHVGQIIERKGVRTLLEACHRLKAKHLPFTLLLIGDGEQRPELEAYTQTAGLEDAIHWLGKIDYGALGSYFKQADVFVFSTNEDIWGMVLPEAMAFGKAVLCSKGAGAAEMVIHGENGFVFSPNQPQELADLMGQFLETPTLATAMGAKSAEIMAAHTPAAATTIFTAAVEHVQRAV
ncbi:glycosyltransferase family 4 protein [Leptolyngbya sp. CCNP1308]|uniref:glycosyltransferase family 4 protein n=1 Tax=Leptolyngbya sp. CCNP1308 TaxID=3110255 RepID=UPI002B202EB0|nr:glycosyltransferase family 4 protein [Leptolyngbya sp. CCNP1308]MEA5448613.1 glycosyltransferase family 4 protein [Leptolyngbya sp. CCNP1308]